MNYEIFELNNILTFTCFLFCGYFFFQKIFNKNNREKLLKDMNKFKYVALIDIKDFKYINMHVGYDNGDIVLKNFYYDLMNIFRQYNTGFKIFKINGDQFYILSDINIKNIIKKNELTLKSKKIKFLDKYIYIDFLLIQLDLNKEHITRPKNILIKLENILNNKKENKIEFNTIKEDLINYFSYKNIITEAILEKNSKKIKLFKQDIYDFKKEKITKTELLVRIKDNEKIISPYYFLSISKEIDLYKFISRIVINKAFKFAKTTDLTVSINISKEDILNKETFSLLLENINNYTKDNIVLEITEQSGFEEEKLKDLNILINAAHNKNIKISIDDFGSGYSNFNYLASLNLDIIKIDGSIIRNLDKKTNVFICKTIIEFAKLINAKTVAEFVENKEIFDKVKELGFDYAQGYYIAKPIEVEV